MEKVEQNIERDLKAIKFGVAAETNINIIHRTLAAFYDTSERILKLDESCAPSEILHSATQIVKIEKYFSEMCLHEVEKCYLQLELSSMGKLPLPDNFDHSGIIAYAHLMIKPKSLVTLVKVIEFTETLSEDAEDFKYIFQYLGESLKNKMKMFLRVSSMYQFCESTSEIRSCRKDPQFIENAKSILNVAERFHFEFNDSEETVIEIRCLYLRINLPV